MARFKGSDITQGQFLTVNLSDQLLPGTYEWTLNYLIDRIDLSLFEEKYNNDEKGASAYQPKALLKIMDLFDNSVSCLTSPAFFQAKALQKCIFTMKLFNN